MINNFQKLISYNLYEILKKLDADNREYYEQCQKIIENGSESDIEDLTYFLNGTSEYVKKETYDILEMYSNLEDAQEKLTLNNENTGKVTFRGFDGNEEAEHYNYCKYIVNDEGKYSEFSDRELNSHFPHLNTYRAMLERYKKIVIERGKDKLFYEKPMTLKEFEFIVKG